MQRGLTETIPEFQTWPNSTCQLNWWTTLHSNFVVKFKCLNLLLFLQDLQLYVEQIGYIPFYNLLVKVRLQKCSLVQARNWLNLTVFSFQIMNSSFKLLILICSLGLLMTCNQSQFDPTKFQTPQTEHFIFCLNFPTLGA